MASSANVEVPTLPSAAQNDESEADNLQIEAEERAPSDTDSSFGDAESYTTSLKSSITNYRYENGRRYHAFKDGSYFLPNDEDENDRLDLFHHMITLYCGGELHHAPIGERPQRILDLGTGTGIWAIDMGDKYPSAEVLGNDLSPIQPSLVPPNVKFEVDDIENEWIYGSKFDFIHSRYLAGSIRNWPKLMSQAFKFTKPGGWVKFRDFDMKFYTTNGEFAPGCPLDRWADELIKGIEKFKLEPEPGPKLKKWVKDAGFENIHHQLLPFPIGQWPKDRKLKEIGAFNQIQFVDNLEGISLRVFTAGLGWSSEEVQVFLVDVRKDLKNPKLQAQSNCYIVWAQKPLNAQ